MILAEEDVERILSLGYRLEDFSEFRGGYLRLKNVNGRCFFLDERGSCRIYEHRPLGCKAYPVVYDVDAKRCKIDDLCPARGTLEPDEFVEKCNLVLRALPMLIRRGGRFQP